MICILAGNLAGVLAGDLCSGRQSGRCSGWCAGWRSGRRSGRRMACWQACWLARWMACWQARWLARWMACWQAFWQTRFALLPSASDFGKAVEENSDPRVFLYSSIQQKRKETQRDAKRRKPIGWPTSPPSATKCQSGGVASGCPSLFVVDHPQPKRELPTHCRPFFFTNL